MLCAIVFVFALFAVWSVRADWRIMQERIDLELPEGYWDLPVPKR